ncbi:nicotinamide riboside transporter PnuC [Acetobacter cibinongensis]|uniref:Nicotinamide riboside transporter PnuC n=1 Tax=Acetobacter cibinongensis TaxID=146475 RepID=A0A1Z5YXF9_9PROT|nr:nicotinamide riboside transporter PnuC [Acetobacter cibinongensis]OUJ03984.1 aminotransferase [Acetobacter cibinongensis]
MTALETVSAALSALGVWLTGRRAMACWPVMSLASVLYGVVFWQAHLYADMALQGVFAALSLYGWWRWVRGVRVEGAVHVVPLKNMLLWSGLFVAALGGLVGGYTLQTLTDDPMPLLDALLSAYSILAQVWMARRHSACWWLWGVIDAAYTVMFAMRGLYVTAVLYAVFVALAVAGWRAWRHAGVKPVRQNT